MSQSIEVIIISYLFLAVFKRFIAVLAVGKHLGLLAWGDAFEATFIVEPGILLLHDDAPSRDWQHASYKQHCI